MTQIYNFFYCQIVVSVFKGKGARVILITFLIDTCIFFKRNPAHSRERIKHIWSKPIGDLATKCCRFVFLSCFFS